MNISMAVEDFRYCRWRGTCFRREVKLGRRPGHISAGQQLQDGRLEYTGSKTTLTASRHLHMLNMPELKLLSCLFLYVYNIRVTK